MKATLILSTLILLAAWTGCSDNMNVTDPLGSNHYVQNQPIHTTDIGNGELLWSLNELKVWTVDEAIVENKAVYVAPVPVPPLSGSNSYKITFSVSTNADRFSNGYLPTARISSDNSSTGNQVLYEETVFDVTTDLSVEKEVKFDKVDFSKITFYVALFQVDGSGKLSIPGNSTYLTLTDIKIYKSR